MSNETLTFTIDKKKIKADHQYADDTGRAFKDQKEGADQLKAFIRDQVVFQNKSNKGVGFNYYATAYKASGKYYMLISGDGIEPPDEIKKKILETQLESA